ncbi:MAG TPA: CoA ester lyase [Rhizomicrobium sp.]
MRLRSLLFVPGDRPDRMVKALEAGADALILDLEDSVSPDKKNEARKAVADFLARPRTVKLFVRVNPQDTEDDLVSVLPTKPDGLVLPKAVGATSVAALDRKLSGANTPILPIATETAAAVFALGDFASVAQRLCGLTWGVEDLSAAIRASTAREADGCFTQPFEMVRSLALFAAHAAGVPAIETVYPALKDVDGLKSYAARGRRDGFSGMLALHPAQVPVINAAFTPSPEELAWAKRVLAAFAANPGAGALELDGRMVDAPHLKLARRLLANEKE